MIDPDTITYQVLTQTGTALYTLVGSRVDFAVTLDGFQNTEARVVFRREGGAPGVWSPVEEANYLIECYGGANDGWASAKGVYEALRGIWQEANTVTVGDGVLMSGWLEQAGVPVVHPKTKHQYMVCRIGGKYRGA